MFDVAGRVVVTDDSGGQESARQEVVLGEAEPDVRVRRLLELGVRRLICGDISSELESMLDRAGIKVVPRICGDLDEVLLACRERRLTEQRFLMPGCCGRQGRMRGRCRRHGAGRGARGV